MPPGFLVTTQHREDLYVPRIMQTDPDSLQELPRASRTPRNCQKECLPTLFAHVEQEIKRNRNVACYFLLSGPIRWEFVPPTVLHIEYGVTWNPVSF